MMKSLDKDPFSAQSALPTSLKENYGLLNGKMGESILNYYLSRISNDISQKEYAEEVLEEVVKHVAEIEGFDYANGLAGIGYGIEWLAQNGYIDINTDEILEDVDDELYNSVVYSKCDTAGLFEGSIGKAMYFYKRLMAVNPDQVLYKRICLRECLVLLSDEIFDYCLDEGTGILNRDLDTISREELKTIGQALIFFVKLNKERINTEVVEQVICSVYEFSKKYIGNIGLASDLYLLYAFAISGAKLKDLAWQEQSLIWYNQYLEFDTADAADPFNYFMLERLCSLFKIEFSLPPPLPGSSLFGQLIFQTNDNTWAEIWLME